MIADGLAPLVDRVYAAPEAAAGPAVLLATLLDRALGNSAMIFQTSLASYYVANEGLSILENAALLDVRFPEKLKKALETLREREEEE